MKRVTVSAPGKLHLSGEHAVVYGKPALVVATSLRMYVTLQKGSPGNKNQDAYTRAIYEAFAKKHRIRVVDNFSLDIHSTIPMGSGMGSSAALAVALVGALSVWHGLPWNPQAINDVSYAAEKVKHQNSSGSDPAVATHGGILWYRKELEFLKTLWLLPFKIPKSFTPFVLVNTGRTETTGDLVAHVANVRKRNGKKFQLLLDQMEEVTKRIANAMHEEKEREFRRLLCENERLLEQMEIVSPSTMTFIHAIENAGGVAKISGAGGRKGGSGVVIALHDEPKKLLSVAQKHDYPSFQVALGGEGVKLEQIRT